MVRRRRRRRQTYTVTLTLCVVQARLNQVLFFGVLLRPSRSSSFRPNLVLSLLDGDSLDGKWRKASHASSTNMRISLTGSTSLLLGSSRALWIRTFKVDSAAVSHHFPPRCPHPRWCYAEETFTSQIGPMDFFDWFSDYEVGFFTSSLNSYIVRLRPLNTQSRALPVTVWPLSTS